MQQLSGMGLEQLTAIEGVGEKTAQKLLEAAHAALTKAVESAPEAAEADAVPSESAEHQAPPPAEEPSPAPEPESEGESKPEEPT